MPEWKDVTSYSRSETDRTPRTFELRAGVFCITVTRHIHFDPAAWVLTCPPLFDTREISRGTADEAKGTAIEFVRSALSGALAELD